jgi:DNA-binding response OmpR family regulator
VILEYNVTYSVILVDDDPDFVEELCQFLTSHGIRCATVSDPVSLKPLLNEMNPDLLVLDQRLGATSGMEVLRGIREVSSIPCVILTGLEDPIERILGLELGADDYIQKTALPREILARIRAVLRRARRVPFDSVAAPATKTWHFRPEERELYAPDGSRCHLTSTEFAFLQVLIEAQGEAVNREALTECVFNRPYRAGDRAIDGLVVKIRRKVEPDPGNPTVIKSARQQGYVFTGFASVSI